MTRTFLVIGVLLSGMLGACGTVEGPSGATGSVRIEPGAAAVGDTLKLTYEIQNGASMPIDLIPDLFRVTSRATGAVMVNRVDQTEMPTVPLHLDRGEVFTGFQGWLIVDARYSSGEYDVEQTYRNSSLRLTGHFSVR